MEDLKGVFGLVVLLIAILGPIVEKWAKKKKAEEDARRRGVAPAVPESEVEEETPKPEEARGPYLPYEEVAEEFFGEFIKRKKEQHEQRKAQQWEKAKQSEDADFRRRAEWNRKVREKVQAAAARIEKPDIVVTPLPAEAGPAHDWEAHAVPVAPALRAPLQRLQHLSPMAQAVVYTELFAPRPGSFISNRRRRQR